MVRYGGQSYIDKIACVPACQDMISRDIKTCVSQTSCKLNKKSKLRIILASGQLKIENIAWKYLIREFFFSRKTATNFI